MIQRALFDQLTRARQHLTIPSAATIRVLKYLAIRTSAIILVFCWATLGALELVGVLVLATISPIWPILATIGYVGISHSLWHGFKSLAQTLAEPAAIPWASPAIMQQARFLGQTMVRIATINQAIAWCTAIVGLSIIGSAKQGWSGYAYKTLSAALIYLMAGHLYQRHQYRRRSRTTTPQ
jgi:hypothetical protein